MMSDLKETGPFNVSMWKSKKNYGDAVITEIRSGSVTYYLNGDVHNRKTSSIDDFLNSYAPFQWK